MKFNKLLRIGLGALIVLAIIGGGYRLFFSSAKADPKPFYADERINFPEVKTPDQEVKSTTFVQSVVNKVTETSTKVAQELSKPNVLLIVPFTSQAPTGDWSTPFNEACEEASMLMVYAYANNIALDSTIATKQIQDFYKWQTDHGYTVDLNATQVKTVLRDYYKIDSHLILSPKAEDFENELSKGNIIIVPAAGRELGNPYFRTPGPLYHMLDVIGYDKARKEFITNDPGTRRGKGYRYSYDVLIKAIHDWNGGDVYNGKSVIIAVDHLD